MTRIRRFALLAASLTVTALACAPDAAPPAREPVPVAAPPPVASHAPSAAPSTEPRAEAPPPSSFSVVARLHESPAIYQLGNRTFIGRHLGATFLELKGDEILRADAISPGLTLCRASTNKRDFVIPGVLYGDFGTAAFLTHQVLGARTTITSFLRWTGKAWQPAPGVRDVQSVIFVGDYPWRSSRLLLLTNYYVSVSEFYRLDGRDPPPSLTQQDGKSAIVAHAGVRTTEGEIVIAGQGRDGAPLVERFTEAAGSGRLERLPLEAGETEAELLAIAGTSSKDLTVAGKAKGDLPYVAHFDGTAWTRWKVPARRGIELLARTRDGSSWLVESGPSSRDPRPGALLRRDPAGTVATVPVHDDQGKPAQAEGIWALGDDVWLAVGDDLLRNRPAPAVFDWSEGLCPAFAQPRPAREDCRESVFVLLYTLSTTTPKDYDFPLLRTAIKGHKELAKVRFVETEERGRRYFVGMTDPEQGVESNLQTGKALGDLVRKNVQGATPMVLCGNPREARELKIDLVTGNVTKP